ncbi:hypothetical protein RDI58_017258 [Solanum bulbocastanum]|uniref:F-box domain-containing protein n=1 Tax=Solanum bulbocastanum TaxID=147425 RepID=A0AAN8Y8R7_SOLBU
MDVDVATEIISRLPVRSLLRFKCVSKLWMTLISDPYFRRSISIMPGMMVIHKKFLFTYVTLDMMNFPCIVLLYRQFNRLSAYKNLIFLVMINHGVTHYIVVAMAWRLWGFVIIPINTSNFCYGTLPRENQ